MRHILLLLAFTAAVLTGCIEDGFETSPTAQPRFSTDTLSLGTLFTGENSPTFSLKVYNPHSKILSLSSVTLADGSYFRINVDGFSGKVLNDVEIRPNDSIYIFVEATLPEEGTAAMPLEVTDKLEIVTNGVSSSVILSAMAQDADRRRGCIIDHDTRWTPDLPYQVFDSLVVAPGVTLTLDPGTTIYFHDKAEVRIHGTLISNGTVERPVTLRGDRRGQIAGKITYEIMSNQWGGVSFNPGSTNNRLTCTTIENTATGVTLTDSELYMVNCRLHNSAANTLTAYNSPITATACQLSNASGSVVELHGGEGHRFNRCTLANYYLFAIPSGALMTLAHLGPELADENFDAPYTTLNVTNSIFTGRGATLTNDDITNYDITFNRCLFSVNGKDDKNFINSLWDTDPELDFDLTYYTFDYSPSADSPATNAADTSIDTPDVPDTDAHGRPLGSTIGCYAPAPETDEE